MRSTKLTRRTVLATAAFGAAAASLPFVRSAAVAGPVQPKGKMVLAWHTNIAPRWLDPLQHDGLRARERGRAGSNRRRDA